MGNDEDYGEGDSTVGAPAPIEPDGGALLDHHEEPRGSVEAAEPSSVIHSTRASRAWIRVLPSIVVLAVMLVFIFQNRQNVKVSFFSAQGSWPLSVSLLAAAALGATLVLALGSIRIVQLRRQLHRRNNRATLRDDGGRRARKTR